MPDTPLLGAATASPLAAVRSAVARVASSAVGVVAAAPAPPPLALPLVPLARLRGSHARRAVWQPCLW